MSEVPARRLPVREAAAAVFAALTRWGATAATASCVADHLVEAELVGHHSHGLRMMRVYRELVESGHLAIGAEPRLVRATGSIVEIDCRAGLGHPAMAMAVDRAAELARANGIAVAAVRRAGHTGRMGAWVERGAARGCATIALLASSDSEFTVSLGGGARPAVHTNPLAAAVPTGGDPLAFDMATSAVAQGKVALAKAAGERLAPGLIVDRRGRPSTDPDDFYDGGALLPAAGYKGFGLAAMIEALAVSLTGADDGRPPDGALVICVDAGAFRPEADARESAGRLRERIRAAGVGGNGVAPGDFEQSNRKASTEVLVAGDILEALALGPEAGQFRSKA